MDQTTKLLLDKMVVRDELKTYKGYGNYTSERGWRLGNMWISYDESNDEDVNQLIEVLGILEAAGNDLFRIQR